MGGPLDRDAYPRAEDRETARRPSQTKGREASGEARPANTLTVDLKPPEL